MGGGRRDEELGRLRGSGDHWAMYLRCLPRLRLQILGSVLAGLLMACSAPPAAAQGISETVLYRNEEDGAPLEASLHLPEGPGPHPAVVVLSLAGVGDLVERMRAAGWAVMVPVRRGTAGAPERLLEASFQDLAADVQAARAHLAEQPEVDADRVGLVAQGGETVVGTLAAGGSDAPAFLVLLSARGIPGSETFRHQQRASAETRGLAPEEARELDGLAARLMEVVRADGGTDFGAYRIRGLLEAAGVRPHQSSSLPAELEGQVEFFSSVWWRDHVVVDPAALLARLRIPTLIVLGTQPSDRLGRNLPPVRRGLEEAPTADATLCVVEGRVEHAFPPSALEAVEGWLGTRLESGGSRWFSPRPEASAPPVCLADPEAG